MSRISASYRRANDWIALKLGNSFSTMECFWLFNVVALLPLACPQILSIAQYVSSGYLQLVALPLLGVVSVIVGRKADERAEQDHRAIMGEVETLKTMQAELMEILQLLHCGGVDRKEE